MNYTYIKSTQQPPASIPTRQAKNNGLVRNNPKGMPQKFDVSDGTSSFAQGRGAFAQKAPSNFGRSMFLRAKTGPKNAQGIPVPNHSSSDVTYMKKMAAMGKNTSRKTNPSGDIQFKNHDKNTVNRARRYCRSVAVLLLLRRQLTQILRMVAVFVVVRVTARHMLNMLL